MLQFALECPDGRPHRRVHEHTRDDWRTPKPFFGGLDDRWAFTGDACADARNALAKSFFSAEDSALTQSWSSLGNAVFINPPYSATSAFVSRAHRAVREGEISHAAALVPATPDVSWFHERVIGHASEVWVVRGRISFIDPVSGTPVSGNPVGSMVVIWEAGGTGWAGTRFGTLSPKSGTPIHKPDRDYWIGRSKRLPAQTELF